MSKPAAPGPFAEIRVDGYDLASAWHGMPPKIVAVCEHLTDRGVLVRVENQWAQFSERVNFTGYANTTQNSFVKISYAVISPGTVTMVGTTVVRVVRVFAPSPSDCVALLLAGFEPDPRNDDWRWIERGSFDAIELGDRFGMNAATRRTRRAARPRFRMKWTANGLTGGVKIT